MVIWISNPKLGKHIAEGLAAEASNPACPPPPHRQQHPGMALFTVDRIGDVLGSGANGFCSAVSASAPLLRQRVRLWVSGYLVWGSCFIINFIVISAHARGARAPGGGGGGGWG